MTRTLEMLEQLESIISLMKDAETGQRGYLLTGEDPYLEPNINAKAQLPEFERHLPFVWRVYEVYGMG